MGWGDYKFSGDPPVRLFAPVGRPGILPRGWHKQLDNAGPLCRLLALQTVAYPSGLRGRFAKPLFAGSNPAATSNFPVGGMNERAREHARLTLISSGIDPSALQCRHGKNRNRIRKSDRTPK